MGGAAMRLSPAKWSNAPMSMYAKDFLKCVSAQQRPQFHKLIKSGNAYLERADDGSQLLIVIDPGRNDEAMFACMPDGGEAKCIGNRVR